MARLTELRRSIFLQLKSSVVTSVGWIDAKYTSINPGTFSNGLPVDTSFDLPKTPEWSFNISPQYTYFIPNGGAVRCTCFWTTAGPTSYSATSIMDGARTGNS